MIQRASLEHLPAPPPGRRGWPWTEACAALPATRPDGSPWPRITIVTPVYNQGQYLEETLRSVLLQGYPALEHLVVNDGSTDDSEEVIRRYAPFLAHWETQPNQGQRVAINRGFERATGRILAYLNSDDLLLPGALERAALEIDPARGRHVLMGRCRFTDPGGHYIGVEHPSHFESHTRVLQIWKGHTIPQPSVFWTPEVWRECGPILEDHWVDYGLFCCFSRRYRFHFVDQVMSTYRLHAESKTQVSGEQRRLDETIAISRRYWGGPLAPRRFRLATSLWLHRLHRQGRGRQWLRRAAESRRQGSPLTAAAQGAMGLLLAPEVTFSAVAFPALRRAVPTRLAGLLEHLLRGDQESLDTRVYLEHTAPWPDGWVGPRLVLERESANGARALRLSGHVELRYFTGPLRLRVLVDDRELGERELASSGAWSAELGLSQPLAEGGHRIVVEASQYFVPHRYLSNNDRRPLSWQLASLEIVG